jgi:hypothetical protein
VFFHLWGNGGPRWDLELKAFIREEQDSWVPSKKSTFQTSARSFAEVVKSVPLSGANHIPLHHSAFDRLVFPEPEPTVRLVQKSAIARQSHYPFGHGNNGPAKNFSNLNLNLNVGQPPTTRYLSGNNRPGTCSRCLSDKHSRHSCKYMIDATNACSWGTLRSIALGRTL